ncbi:hypothetical protein HHO41_13230 [Bacillus sp. DNRA2]|uniref:hypothetical protein n=1 Tax=Bacillus sp. DNRA2 TaxID=2723053 RepID=UPI00145C692F|nr:hypothetical protein [Bacillus sp. DNRA2]NMD71261.1 hypothetical protein [Bacillus sp. DNRA2]
MKKRDAERAVLAQHHQLREVNKRLSELTEITKGVKQTEEIVSVELDSVDQELEQLFSTLGINRDELDLSFEVQEMIEKPILPKNLDHLKPLPLLPFSNEKEYFDSVNEYLTKHGFDETKDPLLEVLGTERAKQSLQKYDQMFGKLPWDQWDYSIVAFASLVAVLVDFFIVKIPKDMDFKGKHYEGSPMTKFLNEKCEIIMGKSGNDSSSDQPFYQWLGQMQKKLENYAKVPYDLSRNDQAGGINIDGLSPKLHRLMSLGHDPILGFVFGVIDILRGTMTTIDKNGILHVVNTGNASSNVLEAILKVFAHTLSDIPTPAGVQPPFFSLLQCINTKSPFTLRENGATVSYTNVARFMYSNGYDLRHFATMSLVPGIIELVIRIYYNMKNFKSLFTKNKNIQHKCKLASMLTMAHSVTMGGNVVKMWISGWNPVAFNWSEFLAMSKSYVTTIKLQKERQNEIDDYFTKAWEEIYSRSL